MHTPKTSRKRKNSDDYVGDMDRPFRWTRSRLDAVAGAFVPAVGEGGGEAGASNQETDGNASAGAVPAMGEDTGGASNQEMDDNASAGAVPTADEDTAGASCPQMDANDSVTSSPSLEGEDPFETNYDDGIDGEAQHTDANSQSFARVYDLDESEGRDVLCVPPPPAPSPEPSPTTSRVRVGSRIAGIIEPPRSLNQWFSRNRSRPSVPLPARASPSVPGASNDMHYNTNPTAWLERDQPTDRGDVRKVRTSVVKKVGNASPSPVGNASPGPVGYASPGPVAHTLAPRPVLHTLAPRTVPQKLAPRLDPLNGATEWLRQLEERQRQNSQDSLGEDVVLEPPSSDDPQPTEPRLQSEWVYDDDPNATVGFGTFSPEPRYMTHLNTLETFHPFLKLPQETRLIIYEYALQAPHPILPHLCDPDYASSQAAQSDNLTNLPTTPSNIPKFHDANQRQHNAVDALLGITRVSKLIRDECLAVFYSANTFVIGQDTSTYFDRLEYLGRFKMLRNVQFDIVHRLEKRAPETLRGMSSYLKTKAKYEDSLRWVESKNSLLMKIPFWDGIGKGKGKAVPVPVAKEQNKSTAALVGASYASLTNHPQYMVGGLADMNVLICLSKLCTASEETNTDNTTANANTSKGKGVKNDKDEEKEPPKLTLPIPSADIFNIYPTLSWFPLVAAGLGIKLHWVEGHPVDDSGVGWIRITWRQRFGKKELEESTSMSGDSGSGSDGGGKRANKDWTGLSLTPAEVARRALQLDPLLEQHERERVNLYYRKGCRGQLRWFDVVTEKEVCGLAPGGG